MYSQKIKRFDFNGNWEFEYEFDAFKGLQSRRGIYNSKDTEEKSNGIVRLFIIDKLDDATDPLPQQVNALNFILENPDTVKMSILTALDLAYSTIKEESGIEEEDEYFKEFFPVITSLDDYGNVFGVGNLFVHRAHKEGFAFVGIECGCNWDEEHGLGFLMHKDKVIKLGQADTAFNDIDPFPDNEDDIKDELNSILSHCDDTFNDSIHLLFEPHPKYGKLKPSQIIKNIEYAIMLIKKGFTTEFLELIEKSGDKYFPDCNSEISFLESALECKNLKIIHYLLMKFSSARDSFLRTTASRRNKKYVKLMIRSGVPLDTPYHMGKTLLKLTDEQIQLFGKYKCRTRYNFVLFKKWLLQNGVE